MINSSDGAIHKKMFGSGRPRMLALRPSDLALRTTTLIISNEEINIAKIVKSVEKSDLLIKGITETIKKEAKEQKGLFLSILLGTLGASLLRNLLTSKGTIRAGEGTVTARQDF